jgi:hypothetical protein
MPHVNLLIELLRAIARSGESAEGLAELEELLKKISQTKEHVHIEVDYDGKEFRWKVPRSNVTASEWVPRGDGTSPHH